MPSTLINLPNMPAMLIKRVNQIPFGKVSTYGAIATSLGNSIAARWVATFLLHDPRAIGCPSHRVVRADGTLGLFADGNIDLKRQRLADEGVPINVDQQIDLDKYLFHGFHGERPLEDLRQQQYHVQQRIELKNHHPRPRLIGGIDVSYFSGELGTAAFVLLDIKNGELMWSTTVTGAVNFPYISTYLAFRELPLALQAIANAREAGYAPDVLMVDGSGILHPRGIGVASQLGVAADIPTIGVTKKKLTGKLDSSIVSLNSPVAIRDDRRRIGWAIRPKSTSKKLIYVSPGHGITIDSTRRVVQALMRGRFLPEPIYWADRLSRDEVKRQKNAQ